MAMEYVDFTIHSGDDYQIDFTVKDEDGVLLDLGSSTIECDARAYGKIYNNVAVFSYSTADNITVTGTGTCTLEIDSADTTDLYGKYEYILKITDGSGSVFSPFPRPGYNEGLFLVKKAIV